MYGLLDAPVSQSAASTSAGDCCNSCKSTAGCTAWNYCYCELGCAGGIAQGTCQLKSMTNAFYPRWLSGLCESPVLFLQSFPAVCCSPLEHVSKFLAGPQELWWLI